jgi:hypothetical protein
MMVIAPSHSFLGQSIDVGCLVKTAAVTGLIGIPQVIG